MLDTQFKSLFNKSASLALKVAIFTDTKVDLITWENYVQLKLRNKNR
ncbi:hypothetical protein JC2156_03590 [Weissella koreensis KCTC 3621]|nr:hypothetical protein JC2156_04630 [Weissella koreensis KCTC 3621]EJF34051.1 hypothetical protein JC2156_03590 [Weissella koreensis KCTC 3621]